MHSRLIEFFLVDILVALDKIKRLSAPFKIVDDLECSPEEVFDAIMHNLEILGEAMKYVLAHKPLQELTHIRWRSIVDFRNVVAHEYFGVEFEEVFKVLKNHLPAFEKDFLALLAGIQDKEVLYLALHDAIDELKKRHRQEGVRYLTAILLELKK